ncbi:hypothetical protein LXL04_004114 [Taraxacum kok-saghyz]
MTNRDCPSSKKEFVEIARVPYAFVIGNSDVYDGNDSPTASVVADSFPVGGSKLGADNFREGEGLHRAPEPHGKAINAPPFPHVHAPGPSSSSNQMTVEATCPIPGSVQNLSGGPVSTPAGPECSLLSVNPSSSPDFKIGETSGKRRRTKRKKTHRRHPQVTQSTVAGAQTSRPMPFASIDLNKSVSASPELSNTVVVGQAVGFQVGDRFRSLERSLAGEGAKSGFP